MSGTVVGTVDDKSITMRIILQRKKHGAALACSFRYEYLRVVFGGSAREPPRPRPRSRRPLLAPPALRYLRSAEWRPRLNVVRTKADEYCGATRSEHDWLRSVAHQIW